MSNTIHLPCPKGLEQLLAEEARDLGLENIKTQISGIQGTGTLEVAYRLCLWSRLANRVLWELGSYEAPNAESLYEHIKAEPWSDHMDANQTFAVSVTGRGCGIDNTHFGALKVKDAVVDYFRATQGKRPSIDKERPDIRLHVHVFRTQATLSIDLSGESLHRRGYRAQQGAAPLKENLAAAILIRAGWPAMAAEGKALADPMCGSGTLLIEAALMAADIAPNQHRQHWGFSNWQGHVPNIWNRLQQEASVRAEKGLAKEPLWIRGYEADPRLIKPARNNIERAGLSDWIKVYQGELNTFAPSPNKGQTGLVICNPPYGERLGDSASLLYLYQHLGERLREHCLHWQAGIFTGNPDLCKRMGIRSHKQYALFNGALPCKLVLLNLINSQFVTHKPAPDNPEGEALAAQAQLNENAQMFANRLKKNLKRLGKWVKREDIQCYRLYDADMPEYAAAIDIYGDWVHIQEYAPPKTIDPAKAEKRLLDIIAAVPQVLDIPAEKIVLKRREKQSGKKQYQKQGQERQFIEVNEGGVRLLVNLTDYLDTGLFLDHRSMRLRIQQEAKNKRFLNLFCYTATASVHAAAGGARATTSVDLSNTYLDWGKRNLALNGYSEKNQMIRADVMEWIHNDDGQYDLIFIDPPTFSNSKRTEDVFDIQRDHIDLVDAAMARLAPGGTLYFSNNFRRFKLDEGVEIRFQVKEISKQTIGMDFERNQRIHRCWQITHKED